MAKMNNIEFANKAKEIATNYKTLYVLGCFGAPMTTNNKKRYTNNYSYNAKRKSMIFAASADTFGFDCVCLIKGILWGWSGNKADVYGGAKYASNGVPDIDANTMIAKCSGISTDFTKIEIGETVWMRDHIGIYVGDGLVAECSPAWANDVQLTSCNRDKSGYHRRNWTKHGKLPYIEYVKSELVKNNGKWIYETNGKIDKTFTGLAKNDFGWWYVKNGTIDFKYNGTAKNEYGTWNVKDGKVTTKAGYDGKLPTTTLKKGSKGENVKRLQSFLNWYGNILTVDGIFGDATENAVKAFQKDQGLTVDGIFGAQSRAKAKEC